MGDRLVAVRVLHCWRLKYTHSQLNIDKAGVNHKPHSQSNARPSIWLKKSCKLCFVFFVGNEPIVMEFIRVHIRFISVYSEDETHCMYLPQWVSDTMEWPSTLFNFMPNYTCLLVGQKARYHLTNPRALLCLVFTNPH